MTRKSKRNDRRQAREAKRFLNRMTTRLIERGPDHPTAVQLGEAIASAQKESVEGECSPNDAEYAVNGTNETRHLGGSRYGQS